jgi:hypothetical protein
LTGSGVVSMPISNLSALIKSAIPLHRRHRGNNPAVGPGPKVFVLAKVIKIGERLSGGRLVGEELFVELSALQANVFAVFAPATYYPLPDFGFQNDPV